MRYHYCGLLNKSNPRPKLPARKGDIYYVDSDLWLSGEIIEGLDWGGVTPHKGHAVFLMLLCTENDTIGYKGRWVLYEVARYFDYMAIETKEEK